EHLLQLVSGCDLELVVAAVLGLLVRSPALEYRAVAKPVAFHMIVLHLAHPLDPQRLPGKILAGTPAALAAGHAARLSFRPSPGTPRMLLERLLAQRRELFCELLAHLHRERRRHADVLERPFIIVESEEQRPHRVLAALVPAKARNHTVGGAHMLDLEHRRLCGLIRCRRRFGDHTVEPGALEALEPVDRQVAVPRHRREVEGTPNLPEELLEPDPAFLLWHVQQTF